MDNSCMCINIKAMRLSRCFRIELQYQTYSCGYLRGAHHSARDMVFDEISALGCSSSGLSFFVLSLASELLLVPGKE
jgi:hypothetical protein